MIKHVFWSLSISMVLIFATCNPSDAGGKKVALIIGNDKYQHIAPLRNPGNDAKLVAKTLKKLKFDVDLRIDTNRQDLLDALSDFKNNTSKKIDVVLFYYAGHGVQLAGQNYLIPVDINIKRANQLESKSVNTNLVFSALTNKSVNIIILDACRNNPFIDIFSRNSRSLTNNKRAITIEEQTRSGLSRISAPINTLISFSTSPGNVALDGEGSNSYFTEALVKAWKKEGLDAEQVFKMVRKNVYKETKGKQVPWENSSLVENFFFKPRKQVFQIF